MAKRIRIVTDSYGGFEVQVWRWWWPFWVQFGGINTHRSLESARLYARRIAELSLQTSPSRVVEYLNDKEGA